MNAKHVIWMWMRHEWLWLTVMWLQSLIVQCMGSQAVLFNFNSKWFVYLNAVHITNVLFVTLQSRCIDVVRWSSWNKCVFWFNKIRNLLNILINTDRYRGCTVKFFDCSVKLTYCHIPTLGQKYCNIYHPRSKGGIVFSNVRLCVCLSVCQHVNS